VNARLAVGLGAGLALLAAGLEYAHAHRVTAAAGALLAGALAAALVWFVTTLPGLTARGLVIGGFFVAAGMLSWTYIEHGFVVWAVLAVEGVIFAVWSWPWLRHLPAVSRLGTGWLGLAYWLLGIVGGLLMVRLDIAAERLAYAGVFTLAVLAVVATVRRDIERDPSVGIVGAFLVAIAALLLSGSGNLFETIHVVPAGGWGHSMERRFWGGHWLLYHPNSLAAIAVLATIRIGADRAFALWQRVTVTLLAGFVVWETNSRSGFVFFGAAATVHAFLLWRRRGTGLPRYRRPWLAAATPFAVLALVLALSDGGFLFKSRYGGDDPTSGRAETWKRVGVEWLDARFAEKLFGDTKTTRAVVNRADDGTAGTADKQLNLTTDNAAVGALRRGGVLGELAFLLGLGLLLWHATRGLLWQVRSGRRDPASGAGAGAGGAERNTAPAWFTVAAVATLPTIATTDWLLGGTGGTLWILLVAGEAWLLFAPAHAAEPAGALSEP
jgi:hypothetical protein